MNSALEAMAKVYCEAEPCTLKWDGAPEHCKEAILTGLRAALLALAEGDLPIDAIVEGAEWRTDLQTLPQDARSAIVKASFRAILRSIASEGNGSNG